MTKSDSKAGSSAASGIGALFDIEQNSLDAVASTYTSLFGNVARAQAEVLRFLSERFVKDTRMLSRFAACKSPADVVELQLELGSGVIADYVAETQRMMGLFEQAASESLAATH